MTKTNTMRGSMKKKSTLLVLQMKIVWINNELTSSQCTQKYSRYGLPNVL